MAARTDTYVAFMRGINVGGKNKLPMRDLVAMFTEAGCTDVRTYIQSGNVVFSAPPESTKRRAGRGSASADWAPRFGELTSAEIMARFRLKVPLVLRTADELRRVAKGNPFLKSGADEDSLHVAFLGNLPGAKVVASLDHNRSPGDSFEVRGREVYLHLPNGVARTKLTNAYFDSKLATVSTMRNWRTVLKLIEMTQATE